MSSWFSLLAAIIFSKVAVIIELQIFNYAHETYYGVGLQDLQCRFLEASINPHFLQQASSYTQLIFYAILNMWQNSSSASDLQTLPYVQILTFFTQYNLLKYVAHPSQCYPREFLIFLIP